VSRRPLWLVALFAVSCHTVIGYEESKRRPDAGPDSSLGGAGGAGGSTSVSDSAAGTAGDAGGGGGAAGEAGPSLCDDGPTMVTVAGGGTPFTIHSTEVTRCQYARFLATEPTQTVHLDVCSWNVDFAPGESCVDGEGQVAGNYPRNCVDWCDAAQYCEYVGMRLCGSKSGGPSTETDADDATVDQYYDACTSFGAHNYPYGGDPEVSSDDGYQPDACNGIDHGLNKALPVAALTTCQSSVQGYEGVFDLSGNLMEWEDLCFNDGATHREDTCSLRGGSHDASYSKLRCRDSTDASRLTQDAQVGFRCCG